METMAPPYARKIVYFHAILMIITSDNNKIFQAPLVALIISSLIENSIAGKPWKQFTFGGIFSNNSYQSTYTTTLFEALCGRKCRSLYVGVA